MTVRFKKTAKGEVAILPRKENMSGSLRARLKPKKMQEPRALSRKRDGKSPAAHR